MILPRTEKFEEKMEQGWLNALTNKLYTKQDRKIDPIP
jgi:hypothetical protein